MENQTEVPANQPPMGGPDNRNKKIVKWAVIGVAAFFLTIILVIVGILIAIFITGKNYEKQKNMNKNIAPAAQENAPISSMKNALPPSGSKPDTDNTFARKSLFYDMTAEQITSAVDCAEDSALNPPGSGAGNNVCLDKSVSADTYPAVDPGICDGDNYTISIIDSTPGDGMFKYEFSCNIKGELYRVPCSENGCKR